MVGAKRGDGAELIDTINTLMDPRVTCVDNQAGVSVGSLRRAVRREDATKLARPCRHCTDHSVSLAIII